MEVFGAVASGVTLAALFKHTHSDVWELIQLYRTCDTDFDNLRLQFELEKCRLYNWGSEMGFCLRQMIHLLSDAQRVEAKYAGIEAASGMTETPTLDAHGDGGGVALSDNVKHHFSKRAKSQFRKTSWIIRDRKKFITLIDQVCGLIDALQGITNGLLNATRLEETPSKRINQILDPSALITIARVWETSHPGIASAASTTAQSVSLQSVSNKEDIAEWSRCIDMSSIAYLEDLTITELKHTAFKRIRENSALKTNLECITDDKEKVVAHLVYQEWDV